MAPNLSWLQACKSAQLKSIATAIGVNSSGTKSLLTSQLTQHLPHGYFTHDATKPLPKDEHDIISIDMGIRNLAYCRLTLPREFSSAKPNLPSRNGTPIMSEWARISISRSASKPQKPNEDPPTKEAFDPATYSQHAYNLITHLLTTTPQKPHPPTQILIERQRFRSMGGSSVQEWTLRVNMFEAMLYAVLKTLSEQGVWGGSVYAVAPAKVSRLWLGDGEGAGDGAGGRGTKSARTKTAKVGLVEGWLEGEGGFELVGEAEVLGRAFLRKRRGGKRGGGKEKGRVTKLADMGKLDDLADCLLQGMAWIKWEQNRKLILSKGIEALDEIG